MPSSPASRPGTVKTVLSAKDLLDLNKKLCKKCLHRLSYPEPRSMLGFIDTVLALNFDP